MSPAAPALLLASLLWAGTGAAASTAEPPPLALLSTPVGGAVTTLRLQPARGELSPPVATLSHRPDAVVLGAVLPGTSTVLATALVAAGADESWVSTLFRLEPGAASTPLVDRVYCYTRPLVTPRGRVFVQRGRAGPSPSSLETEGTELRRDELTVDEVNPRTGSARTVYRTEGYLAFLAGVLEAELIVYRVAPEGAELLAVQMDTGLSRPLGALAPYARDFVVDATSGTLYFTQKAGEGWQVESLSLRSGARGVKLRAGSMALLPTPWPGGRLGWNQDGAAGLQVEGSSASSRRARRPGVERVRGFTRDKRWAFGVREEEGELPRPFLMHPQSFDTVELTTAPGERVDVAGAVEAGAR